MNQLYQRGQFSGEILVSYRGKKIFSGGFGKADKKQGMNFTPNTPCYIASLTKPFTAMAVMILAERSRLALDDSVEKFFPGMMIAKHVTIRNLLNHTSGIPDYVEIGYEHPGVTNQEIIEKLGKIKKPDFLPGYRFEYSNSNYILLAEIIEKVTNRTYKNFIEQEIFKPLKMHNSFVYDGKSSHTNNIARGYNRFGDDDDYNILTEGDGSIYSTVNDFYKWDKALTSDKLVNDTTFKIALSPPLLKNGTLSNYGFGWGIGTLEGEQTASHAGRYGGFNTYIKRFLSSHTAIIFFTNSDFKNIGAIGNAIIAILYDQPYQLPKISVANEMWLTYQKTGIDSVINEYEKLKHSDTTYDFGESELNELGYHFLALKKNKEAILILWLNTIAYPASSNAFEGLGEAYVAADDKQDAIINFDKALAIDPNNSDALSFMKKLQ